MMGVVLAAVWTDLKLINSDNVVKEHYNDLMLKTDPIFLQEHLHLHLQAAVSIHADGCVLISQRFSVRFLLPSQ